MVLLVGNDCSDFFLLLRDRYDILAQHFVDVGGHYANDAEVIAFLRSRVQPIPFVNADLVAVAA